MHQHEMTLAAFVDGERVEPDVLREALADPAGRDYLIDLLSLREAVGGMPPFAPAEIVDRRASRTAPWRLAAAALIAIAAGAGGYVAGHAGRDQAASMGVTSSVSTMPAPTPTRIIRLEPGVNWTESTGVQ